MDAPFGPEMRWLTVVPPGAQAQLVLAPPSRGGRGPGGPTGLSLVAPDIAATCETLSARGVRFKESVQTTPWGTRATWFSGPDGNEFFLTEA